MTVVYIDAILVARKNCEDQIHNVLARLNKAGVTLSVSLE